MISSALNCCAINSLLHEIKSPSCCLEGVVWYAWRGNGLVYAKKTAMKFILKNSRGVIKSESYLRLDESPHLRREVMAELSNKLAASQLSLVEPLLGIDASVALCRGFMFVVLFMCKMDAADLIWIQSCASYKLHSTSTRGITSKTPG